MAVGRCHSSVANNWQIKPEVLSSIPGSTTFLSFSLPFKGLQTVIAQIVFDYVDDLYQSSYCSGA